MQLEAPPNLDDCLRSMGARESDELRERDELRDSGELEEDGEPGEGVCEVLLVPQHSLEHRTMNRKELRKFGGMHTSNSPLKNVNEIE